ncbi:MAG: SurA N-terminal domain-containing protein [Pseudomonadota bacterium]
MLNALRRGSKGPLAMILIGLLVISFAVWGISDFVNQIDPTEVARAGDTPVSASEFSRVYQRTVNATSQRFGQALTPQQAQAVGVPAQVLSQLITEALQVDAAHALGLDIGDDALAARIREDPVFAGPDGAFDRFRFDNLMGENRYTEAEFIELQRNTAAQEMLMNALVGGIKAPTAYLEAYNRFSNQTRVVNYLTLNDAALGPIEDPTDTVLRAFYEANKVDFQAPEYRDISTVTLSAEALADPAEVSADAVRRAYEAGGAFGTPERRRVQQVIFDNLEIAQKAAIALNDGTAFSAILRELERSFDDVDLGLVTRDELIDPAVADTAFELDVKGAAAIEGRFGPVLVRVSEIEEAGKQPFEEVEGQIRQELALEEAADQVRGLYDNVEDAVAGGAKVDEIASRFSLPERELNVDSDGNTTDGAPVSPPVPPGVLASAFSASAGDDAEPVEHGDAFTWVQVNAVTPVADRPFDDVAADVLVAWTEAQKASQLAEIAKEALQAVKDGTSIAEVGQKYGIEAQTTDPFSQSEPAANLPQVATEAAFDGPVGHTAAVATDDGDQIVLEVTEVSEPAFFEADADLQSPRRALDEGLAEALIYEFVNDRQGKVGATVNQPLVSQLIGLTPIQHGGGMMR